MAVQLPEQWEQVFEHLAVGVAVADPDEHTLLAVNPAFARMHGYSVPELAGRSLAEMLAPESRAQLPLHAQIAGEQGHHVFESIHLRKDGSSFPVQTDVTAVKAADGSLLYHVAYFQDMSERKQAAAALAVSERRYRDLFENANDIIYTLDTAGNLTGINRRGEEITGYARSELIGKTIGSLVVPDYWEQMQQMLARKVAGEPKTTYELRILTASGEQKTLEVSSRLVREDGRPAGVHGIARDISERRHMEAALRVSRDQLQAIFQSVADGVMVQSPDGAFLYANDAAARLCGYASVDALLSASLADVLQHFAILDEEGQPLPREQLPAQRAFQGEEAPSALLRFRQLASGEERWAIVQTRPVFEEAGRVQYVVSAFQEITALKRHEIEQRFLSEASGILASSLDYETTLARVADLTIPVLADWATVDIAGEAGTVRQVAVAHADPATIALACELRERYPRDPSTSGGVAGVLRSGQPETHWEISDAMLEAAAVDDRHLTLLRGLGLRSLLVVPLVARGRTLGALSIAYAGSDRRYTPADLALAEELAQRAALAVDHARLYRDVQEALQVRDDFLSAVSHDLRTPLSTIKGMTQLVLRQAQRSETLVSARVAERLTEVDRCANRMVAMIDELLDLVRMEAGRRLELDRQTVNLVELARQAAAEAQRTTRHHRISVEANMSEAAGRWDRPRLERAVMNLLSNAIKYSPDGGDIRVTVRRSAGGAEGSWVDLVVQDQGLGIPAADLPHIFEPFHRGKNVSGRIQGIGIGLAGVKQIVQQHGGTIAVESIEGAGACFTVRLPLETQAVEEAFE